MSVLIKGMNLPSSCSDCPLNYDMMSCIITGTRWWSDRIMLMNFDCDKERLYDCPLIEVPTTHGRLGDLDKLKEQIKISCEDACMGNPWKQGMMYACGLIDIIPTIIKEEVGE